MMNIGIVGAGGFATSHHEAVLALEKSNECRLICTCDPNADALNSAAEKYDFSRRGVKTYSDYREMLDAHGDDLHLVTLPSPLPLHAEMHAAVVGRGLGCYLEKPPTLDPSELERMIAEDTPADSAYAPHKTQVGFNFIVEESRQRLKERLLDGEFGELRRVSFIGLWPRHTTYYTRNGWAGKLLWRDRRLVLDSCIGNAMAHYTHNTLFWCGKSGLLDWAEPSRITAELYRSHEIESFDSCFLSGECEGGAEVRIAATHACEGGHDHREEIECERATITYLTGREYRIEWKDGRSVERREADRRNLLQENLRHYFAYLRGEESRPLNRLEDARPFVHLHALAFLSSNEITQVESRYIRRVDQGDKGEYRVAEGMREACEEFMRSGQRPGDQARPWARSDMPESAGPEVMEQLDALIHRIAGA